MSGLNSHDKGVCFEWLSQQWLSKYFARPQEKIYPYELLPEDFRCEYGLPEKDMGVDGFIVGPDRIIPYQAKYRNKRSLSWSELSTFTGLSSQFDERLVVTNVDKVSSVYEGVPGSKVIVSSAFQQLSCEDWQCLLLPPSYSVSETEIKPYDIQEECVRKTVSYLRKKGNARAQIKGPCGIGKTLMGIWIYERLRFNTSVVFVPSLALMSQTIKVWRDHFKSDDFSFLSVCSDHEVGNDSYQMTISEFPFEVTTCREKIREFGSQKGRKVIFCTYHSSRLLAALGREVGLAIYDEAHWTATNRGSDYAATLFDDCLKVKKRLFMTATRKVFRGRSSQMLSMDDKAIYGPVVFSYSLRQAIDDEYLLPYKIVVLMLKESDISQYLLEQSVTTVSGYECRSDTVATAVGLKSAMEQGISKRALVFHNRISDSKTFSQVFPAIYPVAKSSHIDGKMSSSKKSEALSVLEMTGESAVSNVRCLAEGVDCPDIDTTVFADTKQSLSDIIQIIGRVVRKGQGQECGHVVIPIFVGEEGLIDESVIKSRFRVLWMVLEALMKEDPVLRSAIKRLGRSASRLSHSDQLLDDLLEFHAPSIDLRQIMPAISATIGLKYTGSWDKYFNELKKFKERSGHLRIPNNYKIKGLQSWCYKMRTAKRQGLLSKEKINALEGIGFIWQQSNLWDAQLEEYMSLYRTLDGAIPHSEENAKIINWAQKQRYEYKNGLLSDERRKKLLSSGFPIDPAKKPFLDKFKQCRDYYRQYGNCKIPDKKEFSALRSWVNRAKKKLREGKLDDFWVEQLKSIGVT